MDQVSRMKDLTTSYFHQRFRSSRRMTPMPNSDTTNKQPNKFVRAMRKVYRPIGFSKGYNFTFYFIFGGAFLGFILARFAYLNFNANFCAPNGQSANLHAALGECYYYLGWNRYKAGVMLHLACVLPGGFLAMLQFTPVIRHKLLIFHRINGYVIITLMFLGNIGALMIADKAFGGTLATQSYIGALFIMGMTGLGMALYNIKILRIDLHRAWMLRTWYYFGSILTVRFIMILMAIIISSSDYTFVQPCGKLLNAFDGDNNNLTSLYPTCASFVNGTDLKSYAIVHCNISGNVAEAASALDISFGPACWIALWLHTIGVEVYLHMTPKESERLRNVSYERRLEAGKEKIRVPSHGSETELTSTSQQKLVQGHQRVVEISE